MADTWQYSSFKTLEEMVYVQKKFSYASATASKEEIRAYSENFPNRVAHLIKTDAKFASDYDLYNKALKQRVRALTPTPEQEQLNKMLEKIRRIDKACAPLSEDAKVAATQKMIRNKYEKSLKANRGQETSKGIEVNNETREKIIQNRQKNSITI